MGRFIRRLCCATAVAALLSAWAAQPAEAIVSSEKARPFLLGTNEFRGVPRGGWHRFSDKVAESLGVSDGALAAWIKEAKRDEQPGALSRDERAELVRLRKRLAEVEQEKEILRKAALGSTGQRNGVVLLS